jgi:ferritin
MKLPTPVESALNDQINLELSSAYVYYGMAAYFQQTPYAGFARWMEVQAREELEHAHKIFAYVGERNGRVTLQAVAQPKTDYQSPLEAFRISLAHEQKVSAAICALYELAGAQKDYPTQSLLKWFLDEQVEEEKNVGDVLAQLEMVGENRNGLFQIDHHAGKRAEAKS